MKRPLASQRFFRFAAYFVALLLFFFNSPQIPTADAASSRFHEEPVSIQSQDVKLAGTLLVPDTPGQHPAVVMVHGSSSSDREKYRGEAEMFAKAGIAALIYDKRPDGFSKSRGGDRSYQILSEDVVAAVQALRSRADIAPSAVGLWGISEGAWVASLAASEPNSHVAFLITVGAAGVQPVQQQSWQLVNRLHDQGVTSASMIRSVTRHGLQLAVSAGLFAEATYDPLPAFSSLQQPVLAIWGDKDRVEPALESSRNIQHALEQAGNKHAVIRFFPDAGHLLRLSLDGATQTDEFAPGYSEAMTSWVHQVVQGNAPRSSVIGAAPQQEHLSPAGIGQLSWYHSAWVQLGAALLLLAIFGTFLLGSLVRALRKRGSKQPNDRRSGYSLLLAGSTTVATFGFLAYFGFLMSSGAKHLDPLLFDRTLIWGLLQLSSFIALAAAVLLGCSLWRSLVTDRSPVGREKERIWLMIGGILFVPWALYWQLLIP